jgi:hypothetical protein
MQFFFVPDHRHNFRFFSSEPDQEITVEFSRWKKLWAVAKEKLMLLPPRILRQELAFQNCTRPEQETVFIQYPENLSDKKVRRRFFFYLQKQKSKHVLLLIAETILLPISGLMALLPGPNVFFGVLALLMYTHWQALRGIQCLTKKEYSFTPSRSLSRWCTALEAQNESEYLEILKDLEQEFQLTQLQKILYK